jgi:hypothetical protein
MWRFGLWSGRDLTSLTPAEFMERLGTIDIGDEIKKANDAANKLTGATASAGTAAANAVDVVLKDVAQKFEAFGNEASAYFEGRARLLSVAVAVVLAFAVHVDAIELFNTFLRNPNVRDNVIAQMDAVTKQYKEMDEKLKAAEAARAEARKAEQTAPPSGQPAPNDPKPKAPEEQFKDTRQAVKDTVDKTRQTISDLAALGVPIGWNKERSDAAMLKPVVWNCPDLKGLVNLWGDCPTKQDVWVAAPTVFRVYLYLLIGGLLIGLGGPFWYSAITSLTSIRNVASSVQGTAPAAAAPGEAPVGRAVSKESQPITPVDVFKVAYGAKPGTPPQPDQTATPNPDQGSSQKPGQGSGQTPAPEAE